MYSHHGFERFVAVLVQRTLAAQQFTQRRLFFHDPGVHAGEKLVTADEIHLHGENAKQEIAIGTWCEHGWASMLVGKAMFAGQRIFRVRRRRLLD
jgi:hypothetical protein